MEITIRKPFQGVRNIIRFNWHYYVLALVLLILLQVAGSYLPSDLAVGIRIGALLVIAGLVTSLTASWYIYDQSGFYSLNWMEILPVTNGQHLANINAGFDEISSLLKNRYPDCSLEVFDFYDPQKHTEISIQRARNTYPAYPGTRYILTSQLPFESNSFDFIFLIFAAHEIRVQKERVEFFRQLNKSLKPNGRIIVVEHSRDYLNFLVYNIGFFHFHSFNSWKNTFWKAGFKKWTKSKLNPFVSCYILEKNGDSS